MTLRQPLNSVTIAASALLLQAGPASAQGFTVGERVHVGSINQDGVVTQVGPGDLIQVDTMDCGTGCVFNPKQSKITHLGAAPGAANGVNPAAPGIGNNGAFGAAPGMSPVERLMAPAGSAKQFKVGDRVHIGSINMDGVVTQVGPGDLIQVDTLNCGIGTAFNPKQSKITHTGGAPAAGNTGFAPAAPAGNAGFNAVPNQPFVPNQPLAPHFSIGEHVFIGRVGRDAVVTGMGPNGMLEVDMFGQGNTTLFDPIASKITHAAGQFVPPFVPTRPPVPMPPVDTAPTGPRPTSVVPKHYQTTFFLNDHLENGAPFDINDGSTYTDSNGVRGTYTFDAASSTLTFHGGNYDGQRATYDLKNGRPNLHILGPSGRAALDAE